MAAFDYSSDDDEDKCPLCIEDMDITDKNLKPCPCGFQICQFCYNNIRSGPDQYNRCPACRRPYDDASIEYKTLTPEEMKQEQERKQRKEQIRKQRERERNKETHHPHFDQRDKKHLANVRVIQKNLVYVIGLNPNIPSEDLQQMLRRDEFFGQYGRIQKIVVNKRVNGNGNLGVGVYVTFARKEDAARCIAAVDGSVNDGKCLRAAYGTTKYCSSYLRGQNCLNQNCMFLHEPGEEADNFNRHPGSAGQQASQGISSISQGLNLPPQNGPAGLLPQHNTPVTAHAGLSIQGMSPVGHSSSASASPVSVHSALAPHASVGSASTTPSAGSASTPSAPASASTSASISGATHTASNVPALPAWGKAPPPIPSVQKLAAHDLLDPAADSLRLLEKNHSALSSDSWHFTFVSEMVDNDANFPAMFSLPLDDKERLSTYHSAIAELDRLLESSKPPQSSRETSAGTQDDTNVSMNLTETPKKSEKRNNIQYLLAHLMHGVSPNHSQPEGHSEDDVNEDETLLQEDIEGRLPHSFEHEQVGAQEVTNKAQVIEAEKQRAELVQFLVAVTEKYNVEPDQLQSPLADVLRQVGGDLMQPPAPVDIKDTDFKRNKATYLVDDGPKFDLRNLPYVPIVGDTAPSVWAAIEEHSRQRDLLARREKEFAAAKAQTKKRVKRIRV